MTDAVCSSEVGFTPTAVNGSSNTYFCDNSIFNSGCVPVVGGGCDAGGSAGVFQFIVHYSPTTDYDAFGSRLGYL